MRNTGGRKKGERKREKKKAIYCFITFTARKAVLGDVGLR